MYINVSSMDSMKMPYTGLLLSSLVLARSFLVEFPELNLIRPY
jgi:hypothetical protein